MPPYVTTHMKAFVSCSLTQLYFVEILQDPRSRYGWESFTRGLGTPFKTGVESKIFEGGEDDRNVPSPSDASR